MNNVVKKQVKKQRHIIDGILYAILISAILFIISIFGFKAIKEANIIEREQVLKSKVVKLVSKQGSCSGEQIRAKSGVDYILSAGHCAVLAEDGKIEVITEDGKHLNRNVIAEDKESDLLLIEGLPGVQGLPIAESVSMGAHVMTLTHGHGLDTYKTDGVLIETVPIQIGAFEIASAEDKMRCSASPKYKEVIVDIFFGKIDLCILDVKETASTAMTVPGSSGGIVLNDSAELVGVVSAGGDGFSFFVPLTEIHKFVDNY